jgi:RNA polymerase sigma factor (TIGR02999 family)
MSDVTKILSAIEQGDQQASAELLPLVYQELRKLAAAKISTEKPGQTLQPTMLVHEAFVRLVDVEQPQKWNGRRHFFAAAAESMRRILVENARRKLSQKRGGGMERVELGNVELAVENSKVQQADELLAQDEALTQFEQQWPEKAKLVKLKYFAGLTIPEASEAMSISTATAERYWKLARAWLHSQLNTSD